MTGIQYGNAGGEVEVTMAVNVPQLCILGMGNEEALGGDALRYAGTEAWKQFGVAAHGEYPVTMFTTVYQPLRILSNTGGDLGGLRPLRAGSCARMLRAMFCKPGTHG
jgi:hypothetical protein